MEIWIKVGWLGIAFVHLMPALVLFAPSMTERLYELPPDGDLGVLIVHRGALFLGIVVAALFATFDPSSRRVASVIAAISILGFLIVYARAGFPAGALRSIATVDLIAVAPLVFVVMQAWRPQLPPPA